MKLNKFACLYSKPLGNHTFKIIKKILGNLLEHLEKWNLSVRKSGSPTWDTTGYGQQAGGTHPAGMHSCFLMFLSLIRLSADYT